MEAYIESYEPDREDQTTVVDSVSILTRIIQELANKHSTTLHLFQGEKWWSVNASDGRYVLAFATGTDDDLAKPPYYLISDHVTKSREPIIIGGQLVTDVQSRYILKDLEVVLRTAIELYNTGTVDTSGPSWDHDY